MFFIYFNGKIGPEGGEADEDEIRDLILYHRGSEDMLANNWSVSRLGVVQPSSASRCDSEPLNEASADLYVDDIVRVARNRMQVAICYYLLRSEGKAFVDQWSSLG